MSGEIKGNSVSRSRSESEDALILGEVRDVDYIGSDSPRHGVQLAGLSGAKIFEFEFRAHSLYPTAMFRLFQRAALHALTSESSAWITESDPSLGFAREFAVEF